MKNINYIFTIAILMLSSILFAQNPLVYQPTMSANPISENSTMTGRFKLSNLGVDLATMPLALEIDISYNNVRPTGPPTGPGAAFFIWTYDQTFNVHKGVQIMTIPTNSPPPEYCVDLSFVVDSGTAGGQGGFKAELNSIISPPNIETDDAASLYHLIIEEIRLPVELMTFTGRKIDIGNLLEWVTASENNNAGFRIQKSANGQNWENIGWVLGHGTTSEINGYEFLDRVPFYGDNFYRLKQLDLDGTFSYSNIVNLIHESEGIEIKVLPNPSPGEIDVTVRNPDKHKMKISLHDSSGILIWRSDVIVGLSTWQKSFNLKQKEAYLLTVEIGKKTYTEKILIIDKV